VAISSIKGRDAALDWLKGLKRHGEAYGSNKAALAAVERGDIATALISSTTTTGTTWRRKKAWTKCNRRCISPARAIRGRWSRFLA